MAEDPAHTKMIVREPRLRFRKQAGTAERCENGAVMNRAAIYLPPLQAD
jgi:hypothetical protein